MLARMRLDEARKRLPVVGQLPKPKTRHYSTTEVPGSRPALAAWEFTLACDHRCLHCGPRAGDARPNELTTEEALRLVDDLADIGVGEVVLLGGEAYLRNDFLLVIRKIRERGMKASMITGGLGMTQKRAEAMVEAGVNKVGVSIDGLEDHHDFLRNREGSWKRAFEALRLLREAGAVISANSQINRINLGDHEPLLELLGAAKVRSWQLQLTCPHGNAVDNAEIMLQPYMLLEFFEQLERILNRAPALGITIWPANPLGYFGPLEGRLRKIQKLHWKGCQAGSTVVSIESDGTIKNCPSLGGSLDVAGSWREHGLRALWYGAPEIRQLRERTLDDLWGYCRDCYYAETCMAGCTALAEPLLGRPGNNPFCHHRALERDREGLRERVEPIATAPGMPFDNGLWRVILEHADAQARAAHGGAIEITEPRVSRAIEPQGPGRPITETELSGGVAPFEPVRRD